MWNILCTYPSGACEIIGEVDNPEQAVALCRALGRLFNARGVFSFQAYSLTSIDPAYLNAPALTSPSREYEDYRIQVTLCARPSVPLTFVTLTEITPLCDSTS